MKQSLCFLFMVLVAGSACADTRLVIKPFLQRQLESLILAEVRLSDAEFLDALQYLQKKARTSPQNAVQVPFVVHLPADFKPRHELSIDLKSIPFWAALGHLCGQAGASFAIERGSVAIRSLTTPSGTESTPRTEIPVPVEPASKRGMSGTLGKPARPLVSGRGLHRSMSGEVQPKKSGTGKRRNLNGWPIDIDPRGKMSMNCVDQVKCKSKCCDDGACGCHCCTCHNLKVDR